MSYKCLQGSIEEKQLPIRFIRHIPTTLDSPWIYPGGSTTVPQTSSINVTHTYIYLEEKLIIKLF